MRISYLRPFVPSRHTQDVTSGSDSVIAGSYTTPCYSFLPDPASSLCAVPVWLMYHSFFCYHLALSSSHFMPRCSEEFIRQIYFQKTHLLISPFAVNSYLFKLWSQIGFITSLEDFQALLQPRDNPHITSTQIAVIKKERKSILTHPNNTVRINYS